MTLPITRKKYVNEKICFRDFDHISCMGYRHGDRHCDAHNTEDWDIRSRVDHKQSHVHFHSNRIHERYNADPGLNLTGEKARYANIIVMGAILAVAFGASKLID